MRFLIFNQWKNSNAQYFLSKEQEDVHTQTVTTYIGRDPILFDLSFANNLETDSNISFSK